MYLFKKALIACNTWSFFFQLYVPLDSQNPSPIIFYSVAIIDPILVS